MPPTLNLHNIDDKFNCNYVALISQDKDVKVSLSNSFGFGGTNASLVFSKLK
jgi:3-oxoacyl-[acyl-carrier-protein] synthase II